MNDMFLYGAAHLIKSWKTLRRQLNKEIDELAQLELITKFWSLAPLTIRSLDWDKPNTWPDPWRLIYSQTFDESSISLAMFYTLMLSDNQNWNIDRLKLMLIKDSQRQIQKIVLKIDDRWFMNLEYNLIVDSVSTPVKLFVQQNYTFDGRTHIIENR